VLKDKRHIDINT